MFKNLATNFNLDTAENMLRTVSKKNLFSSKFLYVTENLKQ